jgi:hypothetical protein
MARVTIAANMLTKNRGIAGNASEGCLTRRVIPIPLTNGTAANSLRLMSSVARILVSA